MKVGCFMCKYLRGLVKKLFHRPLILYENYGPWYAGGPTNKKFEGVGVNITAPDVPYVNNPIDDAWIKCEDECFQGRRKAPDVYWFLPMPNRQPKGRPPVEGEGFCDNCYEILDLQFDYYTCPRCEAPVILTRRGQVQKTDS